jgi:hypothetical protein
MSETLIQPWGVSQTKSYVADWKFKTVSKSGSIQRFVYLNPFMSLS